MNTIPYLDPEEKRRDKLAARIKKAAAVAHTLGMKPYDPRLLMASTDPLVRSVKKVRREWRKTPAGRLQTLLEEERKWKRRATIAANKLADVRLAINDFAAKQCVRPNEKEQPNESPKA